MSNNTKEPLESSKLEEKQTSNEKKETIINIDGFPIVGALAIPSHEINKQQMQENDKNNGAEVINTIKYEPQNNLSVKLDENNPERPLLSVDKQRKTPDVWVQFQEVKGHNMRGGKLTEFGRLNERGGRNYQTQSPGGGGTLEYDPQSRNGFLRIVFIILLVMFALTFLYNVLVLNSPSMTEFYKNHSRPLMFISGITEYLSNKLMWLVDKSARISQYSSLLLSILRHEMNDLLPPTRGVLISMSYAMMCCLQCIRESPCNYIALFVVLAATSNLVAVLTTMVKTQIILFALIGTSVTVAICLALALSKFDFTSWYLYLVVVIVVLMVLSMALSVASMAMDINFKPLHIALLYIGTLVQVILLIMELQMVIGGKSIEISEEEYILAAYLLYTSIVNLFIQILQILANLDSD